MVSHNLASVALELRTQYMRNCETIASNVSADMRAQVTGCVNATILAYSNASDVELRLYLQSLIWVIVMAPFASDTYHSALWELEHCLTTIDDI